MGENTTEFPFFCTKQIKCLKRGKCQRVNFIYFLINRSFDSLAEDLTRLLEESVKIPGAVRNIYTLSGKKVWYRP